MRLITMCAGEPATATFVPHSKSGSANLPEKAQKDVEDASSVLDRFEGELW